MFKKAKVMKHVVSYDDQFSPVAFGVTLLQCCKYRCMATYKNNSWERYLNIKVFRNEKFHRILISLLFNLITKAVLVCEPAGKVQSDYLADIKNAQFEEFIRQYQTKHLIFVEQSIEEFVHPIDVAEINNFLQQFFKKFRDISIIRHPKLKFEKEVWGAI